MKVTDERSPINVEHRINSHIWRVFYFLCI